MLAHLGAGAFFPVVGDHEVKVANYYVYPLFKTNGSFFFSFKDIPSLLEDEGVAYGPSGKHDTIDTGFLEHVLGILGMEQVP